MPVAPVRRGRHRASIDPCSHDKQGDTTMSIFALTAQPHRLTIDAHIRVITRRPTNATTAPIRLRGADGGRAVTTDEVATLVNEGHLTLHAGNALLAEATQPPLNGNGQATYLVAIAVPAAADNGPAAAMKQFDDTVDRALRQMDWTIAAADPQGYAIDPPSPGPAAGGPGHSLVHADLRLTVTVPAYRKYQCRRVAAALLQRDLRHLCDLGAQVGQPQRCPAVDHDVEELSLKYWSEQNSRDLRSAPDDMLDDLDGDWLD
jgi:hypothetical protein